MELAFCGRILGPHREPGEFDEHGCLLCHSLEGKSNKKPNERAEEESEHTKESEHSKQSNERAEDDTEPEPV